MSRSIVLKSLNKLDHLLTEEKGEGGMVGGGPGRRRRMGMGGTQIPFYGGELYSQPSNFGYGGAYVAGCDMGYGGRRSKASMNCANAYYQCMVPVRADQRARSLARAAYPKRTLSAAQKSALFEGLDVFDQWLADHGARRGNFNPLSKYYDPAVIAAWKRYKELHSGVVPGRTKAQPVIFQPSSAELFV